MHSLHPPLHAFFDGIAEQTLPLATEPHDDLSRLARWISARLDSKKSTNVLVVCTGNSRRSVFGSMLGIAAAGYLGLNGVCFFSGGTEPSAGNPRTIRALEEIGFQIERTDEVAPPGPAGEHNPVYRIHWSDVSPGVRESSKLYSDQTNPQTGFAAVMVCDEAAQNCPLIPGG